MGVGQHRDHLHAGAGCGADPAVRQDAADDHGTRADGIKAVATVGTGQGIALGAVKSAVVIGIEVDAKARKADLARILLAVAVQIIEQQAADRSTPGGHIGLGIGYVRRGFNIAGVVTRHAVEGIAAPGLALVQRLGLGGVAQPGRPTAAVDRHIHRVAGDGRSAVGIGTAPLDVEAGIAGLGRQGLDRAGRCAGVQRIEDGRCVDRFFGVKHDARLSADHRASGRPALGAHGVAEEALTAAVFDAVGILVGGQKAQLCIGGHLTRGRVNGTQAPGDDAGAHINRGRNIQQVAARGAVVKPLAVERGLAIQINALVTKAEVVNPKAAPVQISIQLLGNHHLLGRCGGIGGVFEPDGVAEGVGGRRPLFIPKAFGAEDVVGVARHHRLRVVGRRGVVFAAVFGR